VHAGPQDLGDRDSGCSGNRPRKITYLESTVDQEERYPMNTVSEMMCVARTPGRDTAETPELSSPELSYGRG
jgi:hypothetical protein